jgi:hypothetical protein
MSEKDLGMTMAELKRLAETGLNLGFTAVATYEKKRGEKKPKFTGKFEINATITEVGGKRQREVMVITRRREPRRVTLGTTFDMLRELGAKRFDVVIEMEEGL